MTLANNKILSIIIPVYNVEQYIRQCLDSIFNQNVDENLYEVIIVNDGTKDGSMNIVNSFTDHTNLLVVNQVNQGLSMARNNGLKASSSKYVWFVDSDDWLIQGSIDKVLAAIKDNECIDVIATILLCHKEESSFEYKEYTPAHYKLTGKEYLWSGYSKGASQRYIMRKDFLLYNNLSFYPQLLHEDGLFGNQMLYLARSIIILPEPVYVYRIRNNGSIMSSIKIKSADDLLFIYNALLEFMYEKVSPEDYIRYRISISSVLYSLMLFCIPIYDTPEFKSFYRFNKTYIKKQSSVLWQSPKYWEKALLMCFFPMQFIKLRQSLRLVKEKLRNKFH